MMRQRMRNEEEAFSTAATQEEGKTIEDLLNFKPEDQEVETESDSDVADTDFNEEDVDEC